MKELKTSLIQAETFEEAYLKLKNKLLECPEVTVRGLTTKELIKSGFHIKKTDETLKLEEKQRYNYLFGEVLWYHCGSLTLDGIRAFSRFWEKLKDPSDRVTSNYGHRIFRQIGGFWTALTYLKQDPYTRQAIVHINTPDTLWFGNKDIPCTISIQFFIRNEKLHMIVDMRSNDIWKGLTYDAPNFMLFQQEMLFFLKEAYPRLELGEYIHYSGSLHVYSSDFESLENFQASSMSWKLKKPLIYYGGMPDHDAYAAFKAAIENNVEEAVEMTKQFFEED